MTDEAETGTAEAREAPVVPEDGEAEDPGEIELATDDDESGGSDGSDAKDA